MRAWKLVARGEDVKNMRALLYRIANNLIIDEWRRKKAVSLDEMRDEGFDPVAAEKMSPADRVNLNEVISNLNKIESPYREAVVMRFVDDLTPKEISQILGESENVISVRIHRGLTKLRKMTQEHGGPNS